MSRYQGPPRETRALDAFVKLVRATDTLGGVLERSLSGHDLSLGQLGVLEAVHHLGAMAQCDLARKLLRTEASVSQLVRALEKKGLVRRLRAEPDFRRRAVWLTKDGRKLIEKVFPGHAALIADSLGQLSSKEQEELGRLCRKLGLGLLPKDAETGKA
jgi:MarR family 2-MHQ and catechol resistance regulon transcriptional repressor